MLVDICPKGHLFRKRNLTAGEPKRKNEVKKSLICQIPWKESHEKPLMVE
jgi:hypothetical protein